MTNGFIIMTALPPTKGHQQLIQFGLNYLWAVNETNDFKLKVVISGRSFEPIPAIYRASIIEKQFGNNPNLEVFFFDDDNAPQQPQNDDDVEFWNYWKVAVADFIDQDTTLLFASETYGAKYADVLGMQFIPYNSYRETVKISATMIRSEPDKYYAMLMDESQKYLSTSITVFGAESVGKTTASKLLVEQLPNAVLVPEWAREYLELHVDPAVTDEKMHIIGKAQFASQMAAKNIPSRFQIQDTDLLSTIGYWKIYNGNPPADLVDMFLASKSDLYVMLASNIPFQPDILRYGGNVRESTDDFWIDEVLEAYNCNYIYVRDRNELINIVRDFELSQNKIWSFRRSLIEPLAPWRADASDQ